MKTEKEIIDDIISRIKEQPDRGYREGAWEKFKNQNPGTSAKTRPIAGWISAAAALLLVGMGTLYYVKNAVISTDMDDNIAAVVENNIPSSREAAAPDQSENGPKQQSENTYTPLIEGNTLQKNDNLVQYNAKSRSQDINLVSNVPLLPETLLPIDKNIELASVGAVKELELSIIPKYASVDLRKSQSGLSTPEHLVMAAKSIPTSELSFKEVEMRNQNKQVRFGDKFDMALFVSPQSTNQKTNVGGGLTLAYNLTNKISVRTGASYNSYEVGMMKNPKEPTSYETVMVSKNGKNASGSQMMMASNAPESSRMLIPNINAVTSIVQSVDIPLEMKYNVGKSLYAVAGVSYSAIIGQERSAHYVDNVNEETFSNGFPENEKQMKTAVKAVNKTVKSAEENVSTNGFNGFVNFSIGKKVKVNNRFGVSVEPYFKIPVGQYRRADMDYTNGGIRVMTNF